MSYFYYGRYRNVHFGSVLARFFTKGINYEMRLV
jgi:hypothetical protein